MRRNKEPHGSGVMQMLPSSLGPPPAHLSQASSLPSSLGPPPAHLRAALGPSISSSDDISGVSNESMSAHSSQQTSLAPTTQRSRILPTRPSTASSASLSRKSVDFATNDNPHGSSVQCGGGGGERGERLSNNFNTPRPSSASSAIVPSVNQHDYNTSSTSSSSSSSMRNVESHTRTAKKSLWKACTDPSNGKQYWGNRITKKSQWQRPTDAELLIMVTVDVNGNVISHATNEGNDIHETETKNGNENDKDELIDDAVKKDTERNRVNSIDPFTKSQTTSSATRSTDINYNSQDVAPQHHGHDSVRETGVISSSSMSSSSSLSSTSYSSNQQPKFDVDASLASLQRARLLLGSLGSNSNSNGTIAPTTVVSDAIYKSSPPSSSTSSNKSSPGEVKIIVTQQQTQQQKKKILSDEDDPLAQHLNNLSSTNGQTADNMNVSTSSYSSIVKRPYVQQHQQHQHQYEHSKSTRTMGQNINPVRKRPSLSTILAEQNSSKLSSSRNEAEGGGRGGRYGAEGLLMPRSSSSSSVPLSVSSSHLHSRKGIVDSNPMASLLQSPESYSLQLSGYLLKRSHHSRISATWSKRFFVTQRWHLLYYKDSNASPDAPLAAIDLRCVRELLIGDEVNIDKLGGSFPSGTTSTSEGGGGGWLASFLGGGSSFSSNSNSSSSPSASEIKCFFEIVLSSENDTPMREENQQQRQNYLLKASTESEAREWHDGLLSLLMRYGCDPLEGSLLEKKLHGGYDGSTRGDRGGSNLSARHMPSSPRASTNEAEYEQLSRKGFREPVPSTDGNNEAEAEKERGSSTQGRRLGILASVEAVLNGQSSSSSSASSNAAYSSSSSSSGDVSLKGPTENTVTSAFSKETIVPRSARSVEAFEATPVTAIPPSTTSYSVLQTTSATSSFSSSSFTSLSPTSSETVTIANVPQKASSSSSAPSSSISLPPVAPRPRPSSDAASQSAIFSASRILHNPPSALTSSISSASLLSLREKAASICSRLNDFKKVGAYTEETDYFALTRALGTDLSASVSEVMSLIRSSPAFTQKLASEFVSASKTFQFCSFLRRGPLGNVGPFPVLALHSEAQKKLSNQGNTSSSTTSPGDALFANAITTQLMQWLAAVANPGDLATLEKAFEGMAEDSTRTIKPDFDTENTSDNYEDSSANEIFSFLLARACHDSFLLVLPPSVLLSMLITVAHRGRASAAESLAMQLLPVLESYWSLKLNLKKSVIDVRIRRLARAAGSGAPTVERALTTLLRTWSKLGFLLFDRLSPLLQADLAMPSDWRDKVLEARGVSGPSSSSSSSAASSVVATAVVTSLRARLSLEMSSQSFITAHDLVLLQSAIQRVLLSCADSYGISDDDEEKKKSLVGLSFSTIVVMDEIDDQSITKLVSSASVINSLCEVSFTSPQISLLPNGASPRCKRLAGTQPLVALNRLDEAKATARQLKDCYDETGIQISTLSSMSLSSSSSFSLSELSSSPLPHSIEAEIVTLSKRLSTLLPVLEHASNELNVLNELIKKSEEELKRQVEEAEQQALIRAKQHQQQQQNSLLSSSKHPLYPPAGEGKLTTVKQLVFASPPLPPSSGFSFSSRTLEQDQHDAAHAAARAVNTPTAYRLTSTSSTPLAASNAARAAMNAASVAALSVTKAPRLPSSSAAVSSTPLMTHTHTKSPLQALIGAGGVFSYTN